MNTSFNLRSSQSLAATLQPRAHAVASAPFLRALLLGGLAVLGCAGSALAQNAPAVKAKQADTQGLWLTVENPAQQRVQMKVVSMAHYSCLVNEVNHSASYGSQLNFKGLPAGQYAVLLRVGQERYRYNVDVQGKGQTTISVRELTSAKAPEMVASAAR